ncbi:MAG TPA: FISUMP domain-containing protein [Cytophagaceae bacterium]|jgi:uncharacterized protein (TIGR02145 family)|nr:FISUMP domain-containing protein [Cytophagaceae bacterium]
MYIFKKNWVRGAKKSICYILLPVLMAFIVTSCKKTPTTIICNLSAYTSISQSVLTVHVRAGVAPYTFSIDGVNFSTSNVFIVTPGTCYITVRDSNNCVVLLKNTITAVFDSRDGQTYPTIQLGSRNWMSTNLNFAPSAGIGSCYNNNPDSCAKYGKLYDTTAMLTNPCMEGWHVPTSLEWQQLEYFLAIDSVSNATTMFYQGASHTINFNSLMVGGYDNINGFNGFNDSVSYWTSTPYKGGGSYYTYGFKYPDTTLNVRNKPTLNAPAGRYCIRCIQNY